MERSCREVFALQTESLRHSMSCKLGMATNWYYVTGMNFVKFKLSISTHKFIFHDSKSRQRVNELSVTQLTKTPTMEPRVLEQNYPIKLLNESFTRFVFFPTVANISWEISLNGFARHSFREVLMNLKLEVYVCFLDWWRHENTCWNDSISETNGSESCNIYFECNRRENLKCKAIFICGEIVVGTVGSCDSI